MASQFGKHIKAVHLAFEGVKCQCTEKHGDAQGSSLRATQYYSAGMAWLLLICLHPHVDIWRVACNDTSYCNHKLSIIRDVLTTHCNSSVSFKPK